MRFLLPAFKGGLVSGQTVCIVLGMVCFSITLLNCIPPPPELQQARARQAKEQEHRQELARAQLETPPAEDRLAPVEPGEIDRLEPELELTAGAKFPMIILPFERDAHYTKRMIRTFLQSNGVDASQIFARQAQSRYSTALQKIDLGTMFGILESNGYPVYMVAGANLTEMFLLLKNELPFYASLRKYTRTSARGEMGTLILVYGYKGYSPGPPRKGKITYQGLQEFHLDINEFMEIVQVIYVPVKNEALFEKVQKLWRINRVKQGISQMPQVQDVSGMRMGK